MTVDNRERFICFSSIKVSEPIIKKKTVKSTITITDASNNKSAFELMVKYEEETDQLQLPLLRIAMSIPLLDYGLFTRRFILDYPLSKSDIDLLKNLNLIFGRDIFVNKIMKKDNKYILPGFSIREEEVISDDAEAKTMIQTRCVTNDAKLSDDMNDNRCCILSSGGKDSLLTYGLLKEIGADVYPLYVNESGGHWRTALTAYRYHDKHESNTYRIWTNVDRFCTFMLDHLRFIRQDHRRIRDNTYPIRLCIFPFYIFISLPVLIKKEIGNILLGNEFDDIRNPVYTHGIQHYYGIYDQTQMFDELMNTWYKKRIGSLKQWSAIRGITGLVEERILFSRYKHLGLLQRSCHSCHIKKEEVIPCGSCSKCRGVLLFLLANRINPLLINYKQEHIRRIQRDIKEKRLDDLKLDDDEKNKCLHLIKQNTNNEDADNVKHVTQIHVDERYCDPSMIPERFRDKILNILEEYTDGYCILEKNKWVTIKQHREKNSTTPSPCVKHP